MKRCVGLGSGLLLLGVVAAGAQTFTDQWSSRGFESEESTQGVALGDFDGDGDPDVFITSLRVAIPNPFGDDVVLSGPDRLYRNDGATVTDVAPSVGLDDGGQGQGAAWADWDNDGLLDLYVVRGFQEAVSESHLLYRQTPGGFDAGPSASVDDAGAGRGACWADPDNDGDLDVFVTNGLDSGDLLPDARVHLYGNNGDGTFSDITVASGLLDQRNGWACAWADFDNDGDQDLYVSNHGFEDPVIGLSDPQANALYKNMLKETGTATFVDVAAEAGVDGLDGLLPGEEGASASFGVAWADYDNDGDLDLFVASGFSGLVPFPTPNRLFRNDGDGTFSDLSLTLIDADFDESTLGVTWGDFDNDGDLDLYTTNASQPFATTTNDLFVNSGWPLWLLTNEESAAGVGVQEWATACASADFNGDGFLDIYSVNGTPGIEFIVGEADNLWMGTPNDNHWLHLDLEGRASNRSAVGARITLEAGTLVLTREVAAGSGYQSMDDLRVEFGLGSRTTAQRITIQWPSGCVQVLEGITADQVVDVVEECLVPPADMLREVLSDPVSSMFPLPAHESLADGVTGWTDPEDVLTDGRTLFYAHSGDVGIRVVKDGSSVRIDW
jgi:hypothetical protein